MRIFFSLNGALGECRKALKTANLFAVGKASGITQSTLHRLVHCEDLSPSHETVVRVAKYISDVRRKGEEIPQRTYKKSID